MCPFLGRAVIRDQVVNWLQYVIAGCLLLTGIMYFLVEGGSANSFPTYLIAIAVIALIFVKPAVISDAEPAILLVAFLLVAYLVSSTLWSDVDGISFVKHLGYGTLVLAFVLAISSTMNRFRSFLYWLALLIILAAVINVGYSLYLHYAYPDYQPLPEPRLFALGRLNNPVISALSYGFTTVLTIYMTMTRESRVAKVVFSTIALLFLGAIILTGSRGVWLALAAAVPVGLLLYYPGNRKYQIVGSMVTLAVIATALFVFLGADLLLKRALSFRPEIWLEFIARTLDANMLIGTGMGTDSTFLLPELLIEHPHSVFIATFYYGGVIGLGLYLALIALTTRAVFRLDDRNVQALAGMLLSFGVVATTIDGNEIVTKVNYLWFIIWMPVGLCLAKGYSSESIDPVLASISRP